MVPAGTVLLRPAGPGAGGYYPYSIVLCTIVLGGFFSLVLLDFLLLFRAIFLLRRAWGALFLLVLSLGQYCYCVCRVFYVCPCLCAPVGLLPALSMMGVGRTCFQVFPPSVLALSFCMVCGVCCVYLVHTHTHTHTHTPSFSPGHQVVGWCELAASRSSRPWTSHSPLCSVVMSRGLPPVHPCNDC